MASETIDSDLSCASCGYNLRTLNVAGRCPECGLAVRDSFPPSGFRFEWAGAVRRVQRALALMLMGILLVAATDIALTSLYRLIFALPRAFLQAALPFLHYAADMARIMLGCGLILATWPFTPRRDRFLRPLGVAVVVVGVLCPVPEIAVFMRNFTGVSATPPTMAYFSWTALNVRASAFLLMLLLAWVHLLARVRYTRNRGLWLVVAAAALLQCIYFAFSVWNLAAWIERMQYATVSASQIQFQPYEPIVHVVRLGSLLGIGEHRITGLIWLVMVVALWCYLRKLRHARDLARQPTAAG